MNFDQQQISATPSKFTPFQQPSIDSTMESIQGTTDKNPQAVQTLIDSLFPVLSKSLQTIKEKTQVGDEQSSTPSVNAAMAFALGGMGVRVDTEMGEPEADPIQAISPVSLTNPNGLSEQQTELINIAAGITALDDNCMPLSRTQSIEEERPGVIASNKEQSFESSNKKDHHYDENDEKKRDDRKSSGSRHRYRSHRVDNDKPRRSSSRSPQRRSSHRSSRDDRRDSRRRSSRRSPSPSRRRSSGKSSGSRRRSSSRDRGEKRRYSQGGGTSSSGTDKPYYNNNRRSPTPEMDGATTPNGSSQPAPLDQFLHQQQNNGPPQQQSQNPRMVPAFQNNEQTSQQQQLPITEEPPNANPFVNSNTGPPPSNMLIQPVFQPLHQQQSLEDNETNMNNNKDQDDSGQPTPPIVSGTPFPFANNMESMQQQLPPINAMLGGQPPPMNFQQPTPMQQAALNIVRPQNPLQVLSQQSSDDQQMPLPHPPFMPPPMGNAPPFFIPPPIRPPHTMGGDEPMNIHNDSDRPDNELNMNGPPDMVNNPLLRQHNQHQQQSQEHFNMEQRPPPFPGPPPFMPPEFRPQMDNDRGSGQFPLMRPNFMVQPPQDNMMNFPPRPPFDDNQDNNVGFFPQQQQHFNDNGPPRHLFRPRFQQQSPGQHKFRPRGNFGGPRQFRPRSQRPVL